MRLAWILQNLTLVGVWVLIQVPAFAAPTTPAPKSALRKDASPVTPTPGNRELDQLESLDTGINVPASSGSSPSSPGIQMAPTRIVRTQSRVLSLGVVTGAIEDKNVTTMPWATLSFQNDNQNETGQSFGLSVSDKNIWGLHWDSHQFCCLGEKAEPYWGLGIGSFYQSSEQLAAFVNVDRYHLRARFGFEDLFSLDRRLRAELILRAGLLGASGQINVGWTWAADEFLL